MPDVTPFQHRVYARLKHIPKGKVTTYKDIALSLGIQSSQAVGQACKRNPFAPKVPCHRVVKTNGEIGGFNGKATGKNVQRKVALLRKEGITVRNGELVNFEKHHHRYS